LLFIRHESTAVGGIVATSASRRQHIRADIEMLVANMRRHVRRRYKFVRQLLNDIHDRMPVILGRSDEDAWLDPEIHEQEELQKLFKTCPSSWLTAVYSSRP